MTGVLLWSIRAGLVILLIMPFIVTRGTIFPFIVGKSIFAHSLIEVIFVLWILLILKDPSYRPPRSWVLLIFGIYVMIALISAIYGVSFTRSFWSNYERMMGVWDLIHWLLLALVAASVLRHPKDWLSQFNWLLGMGLALSLLGLAQAYKVKLPLFYLPSKTVDATLGNPSYLAAILAVTILLATGLLGYSFLPSQERAKKRDKRKVKRPPPTPRSLLWWRVFWGITAGLGLWIMLLTGNRGAMVGLMGGAIVMLVALAILGRRRVLRPIALGALGLLLVIGMLFALDRTVGLPVKTTTPFARLLSIKLEEGTFRDRLISSETGIRAFLARPLLGWGPENYETAFDHHMKASKQVGGFFDQAHNKIVEELTTKGALGALSYLAIWGITGWVIVKRLRAGEVEAPTYGVLSALAAYFILLMFLFDTPAMILISTLLIAWVAGQEHLETKPPTLSSTELSKWAYGGIAIAILTLLGLSLYFFNYRPYEASRTFLQAFIRAPSSEKLYLSQKSFDTFPSLANMPRRFTFTQIASGWEMLDPEVKPEALKLVAEEGDKGLRVEPENFRFLMSIIHVGQAAATSREDLDRLDPLLKRAQELAPSRMQTYQLLATQSLLKRNPQEALQIIQDYVKQAPETEPNFAGLKEKAAQMLEAE